MEEEKKGKGAWKRGRRLGRQGGERKVKNGDGLRKEKVKVKGERRQRKEGRMGLQRKGGEERVWEGMEVARGGGGGRIGKRVKDLEGKGTGDWKGIEGFATGKGKGRGRGLGSMGGLGACKGKGQGDRELEGEGGG